MSHPSKIKGNTFEREVVDLAKQMGLEAERAWGSNGQSLGETADVDVRVAGLRGQAKRRKAFPKWFKEVILPDETVDFQVIREDRMKPGFVIIRLDRFFHILRLAVLYGKQNGKQ